jgi:glutamine amidotransferase
MIGIVDYGLGNLASLAGAVEKLGFEPVVTEELVVLEQAEKLILPGVGAFRDGMRNLHERGLVKVLGHLVHERRLPVLGICLGFQLLAQRSEEFGCHEGLGWLPARVRRLAPRDEGVRVPHVGWNGLEQRRDCILFADVAADSLFYYVHSYVLDDLAPQMVTGTCEHGETFVAVVQSGNIFGTQFHPEKSQRAGLKILSNFLTNA